MASKIPTKDKDLNSFINTTGPALDAGTPDTAIRLGLTAPEKSSWQGFRTAWNDNWVLFTNPDTRTVTVTNTKNRLKREFTAFANPLLTRMSVSPNLTEGDRSTFNLPERSAPSERPTISNQPNLNMVVKGGGSVQAVVRIDTDGSKASMHPDADFIELRMVLLTMDRPAPTVVRELTDVRIASRGRTELKLGDTAVGQRLYMAVRWVNKSDEAKNSPWSPIRSVVVS